MKRLITDKRSIQNRVRQSTLIVLIIQVILFGAIIIKGGTIKRLSEEYVKVLNGRVISRKKYLEESMLKQWSDLMEFESGIQKEAQRYGVRPDRELNPKFLEEVASKVVNVVRQNSVTGAFFIQEGKNK